ncbi:SseB family protein [Streptomyces alkaliterrae]|uniref:SseB family protein n=1 Tax=Streptomyces alkaliterrae TaxID=2213162 RepID=A0A5P0YSH5_9ACTN|nr:SseB family protein [Streptomyces alkaliterrae]MBB1255490.1 SseB family protein [Streptomyces alkaliterrae]MBB1261455.1 SseB family protein [Streptomyces alkaliterrae]MQS03274.1 SseB family protein [Streptomyces alkaliterrae]
MALKNIPDPGYAGDDGSADPRLTAALAAWQKDPTTEPELLRLLSGARLLVPVVAVLGEVETGPDGLRREKTSDMAVPTLNAPGGRRALPAFTSTDTLARWRPDARPVAVALGQALQATFHEGADTLVLDLAGPVTYQLTGPALRALAQGRDAALPPAEDPEVRAALRALLADQHGVDAATLTPGGDADGVLALRLAPTAPPAETGGAVAHALAADELLRERLVRGLQLALLPPDGELPGDPLFDRRNAPADRGGRS